MALKTTLSIGANIVMVQKLFIGNWEVSQSRFKF